MTPQKMRRLVVETAIPLSFNWVARDLNGSVHAYEKKPNLDFMYKHKMGETKNALLKIARNSVRKQTF